MNEKKGQKSIQSYLIHCNGNSESTVYKVITVLGKETNENNMVKDSGHSTCNTFKYIIYKSVKFHRHRSDCYKRKLK